MAENFECQRSDIIFCSIWSMGFNSIRWVRGTRGLNTGDTDTVGSRWAHGQAMLAHRRIAYTCNMTAPDRQRGLRLQKFHSVRGSGCKLAGDLLLQICRDRAKKRMTRNRRWGLCRSIISRKCPGSDHGCMSTGREAGKSNKKIGKHNQCQIKTF